MMFTEEVGLLIALARNPKKALKRQELVREARLINKVILGMDNSMLVTNQAVDTIEASRYAKKKDHSYILTVQGAQALLGLSRRLWMLSQLLGKTGELVDNTSGEPIIDLTEEVTEEAGVEA
jgi:hypothetical protein